MSTLIAWNESVAAGSTLVDIQPIADQVIMIQNNHFVFKGLTRLFWAWVGSADLNRARFAAPTLRAITNPEIRPLDTNATPTDDPNVFDLMREPLDIRPTEQLQLDAFHDNVGAQNIRGVSLVGDRLDPQPPGDVYMLRGTSSTAAVADAWTQLTTTWTDTLPDGIWAAVGLEVRSTTAIAGRLRFQGQVDRPGTLSVTAIGNRTWRKFLDGSIGKLGEFEPNFMPDIEVLCTAADAAHVINMPVVKIR